jgi:hypothetical protein
LVQNFGAESEHDFRLCAGIDGRPERGRPSRGIEEAWAGKVFREVASGAKTDPPPLRLNRFSGRLPEDAVALVGK